MSRKSKEKITYETRLLKSLAALYVKEKELAVWIENNLTHKNWDVKLRELYIIRHSIEVERNRLLNPNIFRKYTKHSHKVNNIHFS